MRCIIILVLCAAIISPKHSNASIFNNGDVHIAVIAEVLNAGGYSYIRCKEGGVEGWISHPQISAKSGEWIEFPSSQPMYNFKVESTGRTFKEIYFVPGLRKLSRQEASKLQKAEVYKTVDDEGTLVFTDDPSKIPERKIKKNRNP